MGIFNLAPYANLHEINLDWIIRQVKTITDNLEQTTGALKELQEKVEEIGENLGEEVDKWLTEQGAEYVQKILADYIATSVYFGLTDDGYFVAYIPASWRNIFFGTTGFDTVTPIQEEYGHLVLYY